MQPAPRKNTMKRPTITSVTVEYDCNGKRQRKNFASPYAGRTFYIAKSMQGKNPKIVK